MFQEYEIYSTGKHQLVISSFLLGLAIFVGLLVIFAADGFPMIRYTLGVSIIILGKAYFAYSYLRTVNKKPVFKLNPIGIWLEKKDQLIPWALVEHAVIRESAIENDQLYNLTLEIKFLDSSQVISYPIDDLAIEADELNKILASYHSQEI